MKLLSHLSYDATMNKIYLLFKRKQIVEEHIISSIKDAYFDVYPLFYNFKWIKFDKKFVRNIVATNNVGNKDEIYKLENFHLLNFQFIQKRRFYELTIDGNRLIGVNTMFKIPINLNIYDLYFVETYHDMVLALYLKENEENNNE